MSAILQTTTGVLVDVDTLRKGGHNITGIIALQVGDTYFPERDWNDFPVVILRWWLKELLRLWHGKLKTAESVECLFMDGDYCYRVSERGGQWAIECIEGISDGEVVAKAEVDRAAFMEQLLNSAIQTLDACRARRWNTTDTKSLATMVRVWQKGNAFSPYIS